MNVRGAHPISDSFVKLTPPQMRRNDLVVLYCILAVINRKTSNKREGTQMGSIGFALWSD